MKLLLAAAIFFISAPVLAAGCSKAQHEKLSAAILAKDLPAIEELASSSSCLKAGDKESLLALAAEKADAAVFGRLLALGADPNLRNISDGFCRYQILHTIQGLRSGDAFPFVKLLVEAGADLQSCAEESPGKCGEEICNTEKLPLGQAAEKGDLETLNLLADHHSRIQGDELFYSAPDNARITERLVQLGADPSISQNTPLFRTHSAEAVKILVKAGADINFRQYGYGRAIPLAAYSKPDIFLLDPVIAAIDAGADLRLPMAIQGAWPCVGESPLLCWAEKLNPISLLALYHGLKHSALIDLEQSDEEGRTAIMKLSRYYMFRVGRQVKTEALKLLVEKGANLKAQDKSGKSVMEYWEEYPRENRAELEILRSHL